MPKEGYGPLTVMCSGAGWYVGTHYNHYNADGTVDWYEPGSRDSGYFGTRKEAEAELKLMEASKDVPPADISTPEKLADFMRASTDENDWNRRCITVKRQNNGDYPEIWFQTIIQSGLLAETESSWL